MSKLETRVIQVSNVAPTATKDQLKSLFQFIGRIRECKLFPPDGSDQQVAAKVCYVEFDDSTSAGVSLHLTNTVFIDRALMVVPVMDGKIPDERIALQLTPQAAARLSQGGQPSWPSNVVSQLTGSGSGQMITTYDPRLNALGLPQYPPLPASLDAAKVEEVRRTVYVGNLDPKTTPESLLTFFSQAGEIKYVRMAGDENTRAAYLELTDQRSVATYLGYNGVNIGDRTITVSHAKNSINKPLSKSQEASRREVEEAMKKVQEAQSLISAAAGDKYSSRSRSKSRRSRSRGYSRSRSRSRRRSRSRSKGRRRKSRSRSRRRSRSPRRVRRSRSRSPRRNHSRSRKNTGPIRRKRSRSNSRPRRRSRSRSKRRSRTPPRAYTARRSRSRSRGARRKSRTRSPRRSRSRSRGKGKEKKDRIKDGEKKKEKKASTSRSPSPPTLQREGSAAPRSGDEGSPARLTASSKGEEVKEQPETVMAVTSEAATDKKSSKKRDRSDSPPARRRKSVSRSPVRGGRKRSMSRSPVRGSRRRSPSPPRRRRSKSRSPRRSRSPAKKKKARSPRRSRSGSRHRSKKDKKKDRSRSRDRKEKEKKKKSVKEKGSGKVTRDYDEEEKGFNSASDHEEEMKSPLPGDAEEDQPSPPSPGGDRNLVDMDTSD